MDLLGKGKLTYEIESADEFSLAIFGNGYRLNKIKPSNRRAISKAINLIADELLSSRAHFTFRFIKTKITYINIIS